MQRLARFISWFLVLSFVAALLPVSLVHSQSNLGLRFNGVSSNDFPEIQTVVTVVGPNGIPIAGLDQGSFQIAEEGQQVPLTGVEAFINPAVPISLLLALDVSGSMAGAPLEQAKQQAIQFVDSLGADDRVAVVAFGDSVDLQQPDLTKEIDFTTDRESVKNLISGLTTQAGVVTTPLYDAIFKSVEMAAKIPAGNRVVILFTDGREGDAQGQPVSTLSREAPIAQASQLNIPVYTIGLGEDADTDYMQEVALRSGGEYRFAPDANELAVIYGTIADSLRQQYRLRYMSKSQADGLEHNLSVKAVTPRGDVEATTAFTAVCPPGKPGLRLFYLKDSNIVGDAPEVVALPDGIEIDGSLTIEPDIASCREIAAVEYYVNDQQRARVELPPYRFLWNARDEGVTELTSFALTVKAIDEDGNVGEKTTSVAAIPSEAPGPMPWWIMALIGLTALLLLVFLIYALARRRQTQSQPEPVYANPVSSGYASPFGEGSTVPEMPSFTLRGTGGQDAATGTYSATVPEMAAPSPFSDRSSLEPSMPPPNPTLMLNTTAPVLAWLVMEKGDRPGQTFRLQDGDTTIGRLGTCDVALNDPAVSRQHAKIRKEGEDFFVYDLAATNPVLVNKQAVTRQLLVEGDRLEIGNTVLVFKRVGS